ncbi:MAG: restriction endonuclease subunit S [Candidatus Paceibacterota bacterium]|jgi:type I restriction enzyme S subunit
MKTNQLQKKIPNGWMEDNIGKYGSCIRGVSYSPRDLRDTEDESSISLLRSNNIKDDKLNLSDVQIVSKTRVSDNQILKKGDIFVCMSNGSKSLVGKNVFIKDDAEYTIGAFCSLFHLNSNKVVPLFIKQLFLSDSYLRQIQDSLAGTSINNLKNSHIEDLKFLFPPKPEQEKIAEILSSVDEDIEKTEKVIKKTEKLKNGLFKSLLNECKNTKEVNFSELVKLRNEKFRGLDNKKYVSLEHIEQGTGRLLGFGDSEETKSINSVFSINNILFGKLRPYLRKYWKADFEGVCTGEILVFEPILESDIDFIFQLIQTDEFINHSVSESFGTKMPRTDWNIISNFQIKVPPQKEREKIGEILSAVDEKILVNKKLKEKLTQLKKGLMSDLLSGEVRTI